MLTAILHRPSAQLHHCALTYLPTQAIDTERAARQHRSYAELLRRCGVEVILLESNRHLPDSVFIEDTAVVLDELAIITSMGVASRRAETAAIQSALQAYRPTVRIAPPARIEGGDVLRIGRDLYVGRSTRTNDRGIAALKALAQPHGYAVRSVAVSGCLHLKTGCTALDEKTVLINPAWVDPAPFEALQRISVPPEEPFSANILGINGRLCIHSGFKKTRQTIERHGYRVDTIDISEFLKAEAGLTCMSLIFEKHLEG